MRLVLHTSPGAQGKYCIANFYLPSCLHIGMCSRRSSAGSFFPHTLSSIQAAAGQKMYSLIPVYNFHPTQNIFTTQVMRVVCHFSMHANAQRRENCQCVQGVAAHQAAQSIFASSNVVIVAGGGISPMRERNGAATIATESPEGGDVVVVPPRLPNYVSNDTANNGENVMIEQQIRVRPPHCPHCLLRHCLIHSSPTHRGAISRRPLLTSSNASNDGWSTR
jgi:hypothetical protein